MFGFYSEKIKKTLALTVAAALLYTCPGLRVYSALATMVTGPTAASTAGGKVSPVVLNGAAPLGGLQLSGSRGSANVSLTGVLPGLAAPTVTGRTGRAAGAAAWIGTPKAAPAAKAVKAGAAPSLAPVRTPGAVTQAAAPIASPTKALRPAAGVSSKIRKVSAGVSSAMRSAGPVAQASPGSAHSLGSRVQSLLSGAFRGRSNSTVSLPRSAGFGFLTPPGDNSGAQFARPAGGESIAAAARAYHADEEPAVPDQEPAEEPDNPIDAPLPARIFAALVALSPAAILGVPLFAAGALWAGSMIALASLGAAAMPFFGPKTPKFIRSFPGLLVAGLGLFTFATGVLGGGGAVMGALVALGGWGLFRYGRTDDEKYYDRDKVLTAFFGALGAVAGAGLVAMGPAGLVAAWTGWLPFLSAASGWLPYVVTGATWLSYPLAGMLLMHLPGWVGEGIESAVHGMWASTRAAGRVGSSLTRDTILIDRLENYTEAKLELSRWNIFKVGALWVPVWVTGGAIRVLAWAAGLALGAIQAPTMFLWGAAHDLAENSKANKFLAAWNRFVFKYSQGSKIAVYNRIAKPLVKGANHASVLVSVPSAVALRAAQVLWLAYALVSAPFLYVAGFFRAFTQTGGEYAREKHSPGYLRASYKDRPVEKPDVPDPGPVKDLIPPGIFAVSLALLPMYFFGLPLLSAPLFGKVYLAAGIGVAALPLLPQKTPQLVRMVPGALLTLLGVSTVAAVAWLSFGPVGLMELFGTNVFWMGLATAFGGLGFMNFISKFSKEKSSKGYMLDDPEYIAVFFGALGAITGTGLALVGLGGWLGVSLSVVSYIGTVVLIANLPRWVWSGVWTGLEGMWHSIGNFYDVLSFWREDTKFYKNLKKHADRYLDGSVWRIAANATWLSLIWVPTWLMMAAEGIASLALGLAFGLVKFPVNWLWGAAYKASPESKFTRFAAGLAKGLDRWWDGSKKTIFDRLTNWLKPAMNGAHPVTHRPTLKAVGAWILSRFLQAFWLVSLVLSSPVVLMVALLEGFMNIPEKKKAPGEEEEYGDPNDPDETF